MADHFVKDVQECTAQILKDSSVKTSGMVRVLLLNASFGDVNSLVK